MKIFCYYTDEKTKRENPILHNFNTTLPWILVE